MTRALIPGALTVLSAYPDPPFDILKDGVATGFDIELMRAVSRRLSTDQGGGKRRRELKAALTQ